MNKDLLKALESLTDEQKQALSQYLAADKKEQTTEKKPTREAAIAKVVYFFRQTNRYGVESIEKSG